MKNNRKLKQVRRFGLVPMAFLAFMFSPMATASLIGDVITITDNESNAITCTVGTNCNGQSGFGFDSLLVAANSIFIDVSQHIDVYHTLIFSSLDWVGMPDGILVDVGLETTGAFYSGGAPFVFDINDHGFSVDYLHFVPDQGETITFNLITNHNIPEPSVVALFAAGLFGLVMIRRRVRS